jgi:rubredoxin
MNDFPKTLIGGPDDTNDGFSWVEEKDKPDQGFVAVAPDGGLTSPHPEKRHILKEMVRRYNVTSDLLDFLRTKLKDATDPELRWVIKTTIMKLELVAVGYPCPVCGTDLEWESGEPQTRHHPGTPAMVYCPDCSIRVESNSDHINWEKSYEGDGPPRHPESTTKHINNE